LVRAHQLDVGGERVESRVIDLLAHRKRSSWPIAMASGRGIPGSSPHRAILPIASRPSSRKATPASTASLTDATMPIRAISNFAKPMVLGSFQAPFPWLSRPARAVVSPSSCRMANLSPSSGWCSAAAGSPT
jgi:hypothetical protein